MTSTKPTHSLAYYNPHGVREGFYPYPEECVFIVNGAQVERNARGVAVKNTDTTIVVARRADVAKSVYLTGAPKNEHWQVQSHASLAQLRRLLPTKAVTITELPEKSFVKAFCEQTLWVVETPGTPTVITYFSAHSADTVLAYLKGTNQTSSYFFPVPLIEDLIKKMEAVRDGKASDEFYALDVAGSEMSMEARKDWINADPATQEDYKMYAQWMGIDHLIDHTEPAAAQAMVKGSSAFKCGR